MEQNFLKRASDVLSRVTFPGFAFVTAEKVPGIVYLQITCDSKCNITGEALTWSSRKWLLSRHMTDGEIVQTAFKATLTALEHECRETFKYRGQAIFDPHYDIERLVELRSQANALKERAPVPEVA
jgi:hypothetical protein